MKDVFAIADACNQIQTACALLGEVFDDTTSCNRVGKDLRLVVECDQCGGENADFFNDTFSAAGSYVNGQQIVIDGGATIT